MADTGTLPFHLRGNYAPVAKETEAFDLPVIGALPPELNGVYMRNGANPHGGSSAHWFLGDGMLHGIRLEKGKAVWYRNRYVRSGRFLDPTAAPIDTATGRRRHDLSAANTHIVRHAGKFFALEEASFPVEVTADLETKGVYDFGGKLTRSFTAHPKICPETGEMFAFGYGFLPPYLVYYRIDAQGRLIGTQEIPVAAATMIHDFAITRTKALFFDLPLVFDLERAMAGAMPYRWDDAYRARIGVMPRAGDVGDLVWYDVEPGYIFHPSNAYDDGEAVVMEACRYASMWRDGKWSGDEAHLRRYRFEPGRARAQETQLDDRGTEFPRIDDRLTGLRHRYSYMPHTSVADVVRDEWGTGLIKADALTGTSERFDFGRGRHPGEVSFAPGEGGGGGEDAGYLMTYVWDEADNSSVFEVRDAQNAGARAIAQVRLPQRVPFGFHGNWFAGA